MTNPLLHLKALGQSVWYDNIDRAQLGSGQFKRLMDEDGIVGVTANPTIFQKTLAVNDFYFGSKEWDYPMGHISFVGKLDAATLRAGAPAIAPGFTLELMATHSLDFWLTSEDLPDPSNRVTLDREGNIVLAYKPNNEEGHKRLTAK